MKFTQTNQSKRHTKFDDVKVGQIFLCADVAYMCTNYIDGDYDQANAVTLSGSEVGKLAYFEGQEEVDILTIEPEIKYEAEDIKSWI